MGKRGLQRPRATDQGGTKSKCSDKGRRELNPSFPLADSTWPFFSGSRSRADSTFPLNLIDQPASGRRFQGVVLIQIREPVGIRVRWLMVLPCNCEPQEREQDCSGKNRATADHNLKIFGMGESLSCQLFSELSTINSQPSTGFLLASIQPSFNLRLCTSSAFNTVVRRDFSTAMTLLGLQILKGPSLNERAILPAHSRSSAVPWAFHQPIRARLCH